MTITDVLIIVGIGSISLGIGFSEGNAGGFAAFGLFIVGYALLRALTNDK